MFVQTEKNQGMRKLYKDYTVKLTTVKTSARARFNFRTIFTLDNQVRQPEESHPVSSSNILLRNNLANTICQMFYSPSNFLPKNVGA